MKNGKPEILCGVCGGIAVYKAVEVVSALHKKGWTVHVVMSQAAQEFVRPLTFQAVLGRPVITEMFPANTAATPEEIYPHLYPSTEVDAFLLLPATAGMIARIVHGFADDLVAASVLGLPESARKFFCPAMNTNMWGKPVVAENVMQLEQAGWQRIGPDVGVLACGTVGMGRMVEPAQIVAEVESGMNKRASLEGLPVLILSGPTREPFDSVRFFSNWSSGRMGKALAEEAVRRGADVHFVTGPVGTEGLPHGVKKIYRVGTAQEMLGVAQSMFSDMAIAVFAAAVADYRPAKALDTKMPKNGAPLRVDLVPNPDIAATLAQSKKPGQITIGFALQDPDGESLALEKMARKKFDGIVLNEMAAMGGDDGQYAFARVGSQEFADWGLLSKKNCAERIWDEAWRLRAEGSGESGDAVQED